MSRFFWPRRKMNNEERRRDKKPLLQIRLSLPSSLISESAHVSLRTLPQSTVLSPLTPTDQKHLLSKRNANSRFVSHCILSHSCIRARFFFSLPSRRAFFIDT